METTFSNDRNSGNKYIAFFDLDRTIISTNSGKTLIQQAYKYGLMTRMDLIRGGYISLLYRLDLKDTVKIIDSMVGWLKGVPESTIDELSAEMFKNYILKSVHREVKQEISYHKERGGKVVILSSAILPVCRNVADYLGINDIICTILETQNGIYTGHTNGPLCFGEEKSVRLIDYCSKNSIDPSISWYYGDSVSDLPALCIVGNPVCVNPDRKLKKAALERGWKILSWK